MASTRVGKGVALTLAMAVAALTWVVLAARSAGERDLAAVPQADLDPLEEEGPLRRPVLSMAWRDLSPDSDLVTSPSTSPVLELGNLSDDLATIALVVVADDGGPRTVRRTLSSLTLPAGGSTEVPVHVADLGLRLARLPFSGQVEVVARVALERHPGVAMAMSPPLYFHPLTRWGEPLLFYGEHALRTRFRAGDFRGRVAGAELRPPDAVTTRVVLGGRGEVTRRPVADAEPAEGEERGGVPASAGDEPDLAAAPAAPAAAANQYTTCIKFEIRTADSGQPIADGPDAGTTEDHYVTANNDISVIARGVRVKVSRGGWQQTFDASPSSGCFGWSHEATSGFAMRIYGYTTDANGNVLRIHDDPGSFSVQPPPGKTYSILLQDVSPSPGLVDTHAVGDQVSRWTAMASLAFGLYRFHDGLYDKTFHVGLDTTQPGGSSAHFGQSNASITEGRHYLRIGDGGPPDGVPQSRLKFVVAHELGHAIAALYYGSHEEAVDGSEPAYNGWNATVPNFCVDVNVPVSSYSIDTKEWTSVTFREGFAHFVAARIWNNKNGRGAFRWGPTYDLERYAPSNNAGGRLENVCCTGEGCTTSYAGAGTNADWLRFFWDWYTNVDAGCPWRPSRLDMLELYRQTRLRANLSADTYFTEMSAAAAGLNLQECLKEGRFAFYAGYNGIDNVP